MASARLQAERAARARARRVGAAGFVVAAGLPILLWHRVIGDIASEFEVNATYLLTGWSPWVLMGLGLACFVQVWVIDRRDRDRRFYGNATGAWFGGGVTLDLLGFWLASQVAQITEGFTPY